MKVIQKKLWRDLKDLKVQVFTLSVLVICGVSVIVSSWSAYQSLANARDKYYNQYNFADVFADFERSPSDIMDRVKKIKGIEVAEGRIIEDALMDIPGQLEPAVGHFLSWSEKNLLNKIHLREGTVPQKGSLHDVLVHESFAKIHKMHPGDSFAVYFKGEKMQLRVCGIALSPEYVYALSPLSFMPDDKHFGIFWMDDLALAQLSQMQGAFNNIIIKAADDGKLGEIKAQLDQLLKPYGTWGAYDRSKQLSNIFLEDEIQQQKSSAAVIPGIFVIVGAFILNIVMNRLVGLHRSQISILKALGYSSFSLTIYYWKLATIILFLGVMPSFFFAYGIGQWYASLYEQFFRFPKIDFSLTREALLIGFIAGFVPGWIACMRALISVFKLPPAEGMRPPSPPAFHKSVLEIRSPITSKDIIARMIFRDLLFHPIRSLSSILGIAAATAILINGSFWMDIVNFMLKRQFQEMSREDLEVRLINPRKKDILNEIARLPGVYYLQGARTVPVRLHFRGISKETAIIGFDEKFVLRQILNRKGQSLTVPPVGILMSGYFQRKYALQKGDMLEFELLQGNRMTLRAQVVGFVDDVIGSSVYINPDILHEMLNEEPGLIDTVYLKVDPALKEKIYIKLKESPMIASVSVKELLVQSFKSTTMQMIVVFTLILIGFAVAISGAILFNISRIALSEKSWELASLRILGFDVVAVFNFLFSELGLQVLLACIPGMLLGYLLSFISIHLIHSDTFVFPLIIETKTYALAVAVVIVTYFLSGFFLFRKIKSLNLSEALKARD
ncbi:MAG: ABC transporter permease [Bdellovibrio sp.]